MLDALPQVVTEDQNAKLKSNPSLEEVKQVIMGLNKNSVSGPNEMIGDFY